MESGVAHNSLENLVLSIIAILGSIKCGPSPLGLHALIRHKKGYNKLGERREFTIFSGLVILIVNRSHLNNRTYVKLK